MLARRRRRSERKRSRRGGGDRAVEGADEVLEVLQHGVEESGGDQPCVPPEPVLKGLERSCLLVEAGGGGGGQFEWRCVCVCDCKRILDPVFTCGGLYVCDVSMWMCDVSMWMCG